MERLVSFTPHEYVQGRLLPDGIIYDDWDWKTNKNSVKDRFTRTEFNSFPVQYKLVKPKVVETYHWTSLGAGTETKAKWQGLSYVLCKEYNAKVGLPLRRKVYISENGAAIQAQIEEWKLGDLSQPVIARTGYKYIVGQEAWMVIHANETFIITLPDYVEFIQADIQNFGYVSNTWVKFFDYNVVVEGQSVTVEIIPTPLFHVNRKTGTPLPSTLIGNSEFGWHNPLYSSRDDQTGMSYMRGYRFIGNIKFKSVAPGEGYIQGVQEGYVFVE